MLTLKLNASPKFFSPFQTPSLTTTIMSNTCTPSVRPGAELPYRINGTYICGVNPYVSPSRLASCCLGPITNITSPAPTSGPYSDSWPLTCLAYCGVTKPPDGPPYTDPFYDCMNANNTAGNINGDVCTEVDGFAPNECIPFHESAGCTSTSAYTTSTYWPSGYTSVGVTACESCMTSSAMAGSATNRRSGGSVTGTQSTLTSTSSANSDSASMATEISLRKILIAVLIVSVAR
jgi:hypothetical protein